MYVEILMLVKLWIVTKAPLCNIKKEKINFKNKHFKKSSKRYGHKEV